MAAASVARWTPRRKAVIIKSIRSGTIGRDEAMKDNEISEEELSGWERDFDAGGLAALAVTKRQPRCP